jgi:hypothetical protein
MFFIGWGGLGCGMVRWCRVWCGVVWWEAYLLANRDRAHNTYFNRNLQMGSPNLNVRLHFARKASQ